MSAPEIYVELITVACPPRVLHERRVCVVGAESNYHQTVVSTSLPVHYGCRRSRFWSRSRWSSHRYPWNGKPKVGDGRMKRVTRRLTECTSIFPANEMSSVERENWRLKNDYKAKEGRTTQNPKKTKPPDAHTTIRLIHLSRTNVRYDMVYRTFRENNVIGPSPDSRWIHGFLRLFVIFTEQNIGGGDKIQWPLLFVKCIRTVGIVG